VARFADGPRGHDDQGQRQSGAPVDDVDHGRRLAGHAGRSEPAAEQLLGLHCGQQFERYGPGADRSDQ
jgi:hypothetical protein